jgi:hypothetical protein
MTKQPNNAFSGYGAHLDIARVIEVIETTLKRRGEGKNESDPLRIITQYWTLDGQLICEIDPVQNNKHQNTQ